MPRVEEEHKTEFAEEDKALIAAVAVASPHEEEQNHNFGENEPDNTGLFGVEESQLPYDENDYIDPQEIEAEFEPDFMSSPEPLAPDYMDEAEELEEGKEFEQEAKVVEERK